MNQEIRVKRLLNKIKRNYGLRGKAYFRFMKKGGVGPTAKEKSKTLMYVDFSNPKIPKICICPKNTVYRFEKISDKSIEHHLAHELIHIIVHFHHKEKDPKKLRSILILIDRLIDHGWNKYRYRKTKDS